MAYSPEIIEQVRSASDIVDVVSSYVQLKRSGVRFTGLCPFHNEKTPSFSVNRNMQMFRCFGCQVSGDVFTFIEKEENVGFYEALEMLADRAGITLPKQEFDSRRQNLRNIKEIIARINKDAATYYYYMLRSPEGKHAYEYLTNRGLSEDTINNFGLGFAGRYSNGLYKYLKEKNYSDDDLKRSGMFAYSEQGVQDKFWDRVIFPIMDYRGRVIAFGGRIMGKAVNVAKYLNSPETELFNKSENIYGIQLARKTKEKFFLLAEGYMDVIALHQAGFNNAVASLGTALTERQAKKIKGYTDTVVITYDSDGAGQKAALRAIPILKNVGLTVKILDMKPYKDPDEFILNQGADEYRKRIEGAVNGFDFEARVLEENHDMEDPDSKTHFDHQLAETIARIDDKFARNNHIKAAAKKYGIDEDDLRHEVNDLGLALKKREENEIEKEKQKRTKERKPDAAVAIANHSLLNLLMEDKNAFLAVKDFLRPEDFPEGLERRIFDYIIKDYERTGQAVGARIVEQFEDADERGKVADILMTSGDFDDTNEDERRKAFADYVYGLKKTALEREIEEAMATKDNDRIRQLLVEENGLENVRRKLMNIKLSQEC